MGTCCSKKTSSSTSPATVVAAPPPSKSPNSLHATKTPTAPEEPVIKKEIFVIKQRRSHERERPNSVTISTSTDTKLILTQSPSPSLNLSSDDGVPNKTPSVVVSGGHPVRTSSCTKEEVDAILIQCGRLSRSSSGKAEGSRKYSGSKRSYDFDQDKKTSTDEIVGDEDKDAASVRHYRRTPSRERDGEYKRSGGNRHRSTSTSREEERKRNNNQSGGSRRLSRSPGRRSETTPLSASSVAAALGGDKAKGQPGKMVSVPASTTGAIKRVSVKRATASPRSQSPANAREQPSLSRNSSRKAEHSPYRRNPLSEIDDNCMKSQQDQQINKKPVAVATNYNKVQNTVVETNKPFHFQSQNPNEGNIGKTQKILNEEEEAPSHGDQIAIPQKGAAVSESSKQPQTITRTRSSRRSRDLDFLSNGSVPNSNDDDVNVPTSYASLLLEDIQNFHQKSSSSNPTFSLPPCLTKACSILDAVADLNSSNNSNVSNTLSDERSTHMSNNINTNSSRSVSPFTAHSRKMSCEVVDKDPLVETEVFVYDDLMEPSIHKYITVRRGAAESGEMEQQESSGSNSFVGQQQWLSSSSWEPNSADSTDRWTSSSNTGDDVAADKEEPHRKRGFSEGARKLRSNGNGSTHLASVSGKKKALDGKVGVASNRAPIAAASM